MIGGRIVQQMATGRTPNRVAGRIYRSLDEYAEQTGKGEAFTDNMGFAIPELASGRESFSPDASYYDGPMPADRMRFIEGPPNIEPGQAARVVVEIEEPADLLHLTAGTELEIVEEERVVGILTVTRLCRAIAV